MVLISRPQILHQLWCYQPRQAFQPILARSCRVDQENTESRQDRSQRNSRSKGGYLNSFAASLSKKTLTRRKGHWMSNRLYRSRYPSGQITTRCRKGICLHHTLPRQGSWRRGSICARSGDIDWCPLPASTTHLRRQASAPCSHHPLKHAL